MDETYDVMIVGAGLSGVLAAARIHEQHPDYRILLVEKENRPGGRLRATDTRAGRYSYGLGHISPALFEFWNQTMKADPEGQDLPGYRERQPDSLGVLAAGKISMVPLSEAFGTTGARAIAGGAAVRDWKLVDKLFEGEEKGLKAIDQAFAQAWSGTRKSPSAIVMEHLSRCWGVPDLWTAHTRGVLDRARRSADPAVSGRWEDALDDLLARAGDALTLEQNCRIIRADRQEDVWVLSSGQESFRGHRLVVAQSPWEALDWLPKEHWPPALLSVAMKTRPVSLVTLTVTFDYGEPEAIPRMLLVPAEDVQMMKDGHELCFQATLDYELTLQSPAVVKAVKRLRRSLKKLGKALEGITFSEEHIALLPVAWTQPPDLSDKRWISRLKSASLQSAQLMFCGDTYDNQFDGDQNLIRSLQAIDVVLGQQEEGVAGE